MSGTAGAEAALITGASSGIGRALALEFARRGHDIIVVSRDAAALDHLAKECRKQYGRRVLVIAKDLSRLNAAREIRDGVATAAAEGWSVGYLVNNAGFGVHGDFASTSWESERDMLQVQVIAAVELTKLFLPEMVQRGSGRILNVGSVYSFAPAPRQAIYGATKAFLLSFAESLAGELRGTGVTATALCPGITRTDFHRRAGIHAKRLPGMSAEQVARIGYEAMMAGRLSVVTGWQNKLFVFLGRLVPRRVYLEIMRAVVALRGLKAK